MKRHLFSNPMVVCRNQARHIQHNALAARNPPQLGKILRHPCQQTVEYKRQNIHDISIAELPTAQRSMTQHNQHMRRYACYQQRVFQIQVQLSFDPIPKKGQYRQRKHWIHGPYSLTVIGIEPEPMTRRIHLRRSKQFRPVFLEIFKAELPFLRANKFGQIVVSKFKRAAKACLIQRHIEHEQQNWADESVAGRRS